LVGASFVITDISNLLDKSTIEGDYFIAITDKKKYEDFIRIFVSEFNQNFETQFDTKDFSDYQNKTKTNVVMDNDIFNLEMYFKRLLIYLCFLLLSWIYIQSSHILVLRKNGYSVFKILYNILGKNVKFFLLIQFIIFSLLAVQFLATTKWYFLVEFSSLYLLLYLLLLGVIRLIVLLEDFSISSRLENIKKFKFGLHNIVKWIFLISLLSISGTFFSVISAKISLSNDFEIPNEIRDEDYRTVYPLLIGNNTVQFYTRYNTTPSEITNEIYHHLNIGGSILVNTETYQITENEFFARAIKINPNYLEKFQIHDTSGKKVQISEKNNNRILLIPEKYENDIEDIKKVIQEQDTNQKLEYIFIKNNQSIYTFTSKLKSIADYPMLEILTEKNSTDFEREAINGSETPPLKIKWTSANKEYLEKSLEQFNLMDNYPLIYEFYRGNEAFVKVLSGSLSRLVAEFLFVFVIFCSLSFLTIQSFIVENKRKITILRLNGFSIFRVYKVYLFSIILQTVALCLYFFFSRTQDITKFSSLLALLLFTLVEVITLMLAIVFLEKKNKIEFLNGG
ncbi:MAG: hypothetical protein LBV67_12600, partial [Streptococcaceae bacterium]|nr:hypothetical protein [Streptococcaceae bacterium]